MASITLNQTDTNAAVAKYLAEYPGDLICARQIWYEGLEGKGAADPETVSKIETAIEAAGGWTHAGNVRYEKFGSQNSWKKA